MRVLHEADVERVLTMGDAIDAIEQAFVAHGQGQAHNVPRRRMRQGSTTLHVLPGQIDTIDRMGVKVYVGSADNWFLLIDRTGNLLCAMESRHFSRVRTGAASGVATRWMANPDASRAAIIGSGGQARTQLAAVVHVRPITSAAVWSPTRANRERFAAEMSEELGMPVTAVDTARDAVDGADVVSTMTFAQQPMDPLIEAGWLGDGVHLNTAGATRLGVAEIGNDIVSRCALVVVDDREQARIESGALEAAVDAGHLSWDDVVQLGDVVTGTHPVPRPGPLWTLYESLGVGIEDVAVGHLVYERAVELDLGVHV